MRFDPSLALWSVIGDAQEYAQSKERRQVLDALPLAAAMKTSEIAAAIGKKAQATDYLLKQLEKDGLVKKPSYGYWTRTGIESPVTPVSCNFQEPQPKQYIQLTGDTVDTTLTEIQDLQGYMPDSKEEALEIY
jgi:DNA-binding transcriptional ArsR family regulator